jgi:hypothetical protein
MATSKYREAKKWDDLLPNGNANLGSYRADNMNRIATWAFSILEDSFEEPANNQELLALSRVLSHVVTSAANIVAEADVDPSTALWSQAFWTLNKWTATHPVDLSDLEAWSDRAIKSTGRLLRLTRRLVDDSLNGDEIVPDYSVFA